MYQTAESVAQWQGWCLIYGKPEVEVAGSRLHKQIVEVGGYYASILWRMVKPDQVPVKLRRFRVAALQNIGGPLADISAAVLQASKESILGFIRPDG